MGDQKEKGQIHVTYEEDLEQLVIKILHGDQTGKGLKLYNYKTLYL